MPTGRTRTAAVITAATLVSVAVTLAILSCGPAAPLALAAPGPEQAVQAAWQLAQQAGRYQFTTEFAQTTYPAPALANVGRGSRTDRLRLEGQVDLPARSLHMTLWQGDVSNDGMEVRLEGGEGYGRMPGGTWQKIEDFSDAFAPNSDMLAYLAGVKDVQLVAAHAAGDGIPAYTRYHFDFDGPAFAGYVRDRLQEALLARGELPPGVTLDVSREYALSTGHGDVWIDDQGLPLRLVMRVAYPVHSDGRRVEVDLATDFSGFPAGMQALSPADKLLNTLVPVTAAAQQRAAAQAGTLLAGFALFVALVRFSRSKRLYRAIVLALIFSMVVVPLLQTNQVAAFYERQRARQAEYAQTRAQEDAAQEAQEQLSLPAWDPHTDPLAAERPTSVPESDWSPAAPEATPEPSPDSDNDGLTDEDEAELETSPTDADSDDDGLSDGVEVLRLGTHPGDPDTDGDGIGDKVEVQGFYYNNQRLYLDPGNPDTNGDGQADGVECLELQSLAATSPVPTVTCDTDADGAVNLLDDDDDGDGVPDSVDLSPSYSLNRLQHRYAGGNGFNGDNPLSLDLQGLQNGYPVVVDFQLRPVTPTHLSFAFNVLDWPTDAGGQVQHVKGTTFANTDNPDLLNTQDPRAANGDMRVNPLLEIEISGTQAPLPLTTPAITVTTGGGITATVAFRQQSSDVVVDFTLPPGTYSADLFTGACPETLGGTARWTVSDGDQKTMTATQLANIADGTRRLGLYDGSGQFQSCGLLGNVINGPYTDKMIDAGALEPYGVSVREKNAAGTLLAYVPLNIVPDEGGSGRVAFTARVPYRPNSNATWASPQKVRMLWAIQVLTDECDAAGFEPAGTAITDTVEYASQLNTWCLDPAHRTPDELQVVQTYYDDWYLTGLDVREDRQVDVAIAWQQPVAGEDNNAQDKLWQLARGLQSVFVPGRDCEDDIADNGIDYDPVTQLCRDDGKRDLVVAARDNGNTTIEGRFGAGSSATITQTWGIPAGSLGVRTVSYTGQDHLALLSMYENPDILETVFDAYKAGSYPTLLYAREETYRSATLADAVAGASGAVQITLGSALDTGTALNWAPFRYNTDLGPDGEVIGWEAYPMTEYWDWLVANYSTAFRDIYPGYSDDAILGEAVIARSLYMAFYSGSTEIVRSGNLTFWAPPWETGETDPEDNSDVALTRKVGGLLVNSYWVVSDFAGDFIIKSHLAFKQTKLGFTKNLTGGKVSLTSAQIRELFASTVGGGAKGVWKGWTKGLWPSKFTGKAGKIGKVGVGAVFGLAFAAVSMTLYVTSLTGKSGDALQTAVYAMEALNSVCLIRSVINGISHIVKPKAVPPVVPAAGAVAKVSSSLKTGVSVGVAVGAAVVSVLATWAVFGVTVGLGHLSHAQLGRALAGAIASTIVIGIMFAISLIPVVGAIITNIIYLIDSLVAMMCTAFLSEEQQAGMAGSWLCGGIQGIVTYILTKLIYSHTDMVDMTVADRLQIHSLDMQGLTDPAKGLVVGNKVMVSVSYTNTIDMVDVPEGVGKAYWWMYSDEKLRGATFEYLLQDTETAFHEDLERYAMEDEWLYADGTPAQWHSAAHTYHDPEPVFITGTVGSAAGVPLTTAGINTTLVAYLSEAAALPVQECAVGICYMRTSKDTHHYPVGDGLELDIFPATLDGFYSIQPKAIAWTAGGPINQGYTLSWGQSGDVTFQAMVDADGDGLAYWTDPNDGLWDSDGDGMYDGYETQVGSNPLSLDSDGDGLRDREEVRLGMSPMRPDTDGDGLSDGEELYHRDTLDQNHNGNYDEWIGGWLYAYDRNADGTLIMTNVLPDPLSVDPDGDDLTDLQEKIYGFNPAVASTGDVLTLSSQILEPAAGGVLTPTDGLVAAGASFYYSSTVTNELDNRYAQGLLSTLFPPELNGSALVPQSFILHPQEAQHLEGNVTVQAGAASGAYSMTQVAGASIVDWTEIAAGAQLWLPFDDPLGADRSGSVPPHDATCAGTCQPGTGRFGGALRLTGSGSMASTADPSETDFAVSLWFSTTQATTGTLFHVNDPSGARVYLAGGKVCASVYYSSASAEVICTSPTYHDGRWHHLVHTFGATAGNQRLYLDGIEKKRGGQSGAAQSNTGGVRIGLGSASGSYFTGAIDDLRLFNKGLTPAAVQILFAQPVFDMTYDETSGWVDHSVFRNNASCFAFSCPDRVAGLSGNAVLFRGTHRIDVAPNPSLMLGHGISDTQFTISTWISPTLPRNSAGGWGEAWQGLLGDGWGANQGYPSLLRAKFWDAGAMTWQHQVWFGFGTGSAWAGTYRSPSVLTDDRWQHVAVTFDGHTGAMKMYVNGALVGEDSTTFAGKAVSAAAAFTIGQAGTAQSGSTPFQGTIDNTQIYQQVLDAGAIADLYQSGITALYMPLDEPPGETNFENRMDPSHPGSCSGATCPVAGVGGRLNQSVLFDAAAQDRITVPSFGNFNRTTVAAWVYRTGGTSARETIVSYKENGNCGFGLALNESGTGQSPTFYVRVGSAWQFVNETTPQAIPLNTWVHLAGTYDGLNLVLYRNGVQAGTLAAAGTMTQCSAPAAIGSRSSANMHWFPGRIDEVYILREALSAAEVGRLARRAPALQLNLEDAFGATAFADNSGAGHHGTCTGTSCPQAGYGIQGRIGQAARFDGLDDRITIPSNPSVQLATFSLSLWVKPEAGGRVQNLITRADYSSIYNILTQLNYRLALDANLRPAFTMAHDCSPWDLEGITSDVPLILNQWNHVVATFDPSAAKIMKLYVNGSEHASAPGRRDYLGRWFGLVCSDTTNDVEIGSMLDGTSAPVDKFAGQLDEVEIYDHALTALEINAAFRYQMRWVQDWQMYDLVVDADMPTAVLSTTHSYLPNHDVQLLILAHDQTSQVVSARLGARRYDQGTTAWVDALHCQDTYGDGNWCPTFTPTGAGQYTLYSEVTDQAGHTSTVQSTVWVDDAAPALSFDFSDGARFDTAPHPTLPNARIIHLTGTVSDPALPGGAPGSGVRPDGMSATLYAAGGTIAGAESQLATLDGSTWALDYVLTEPEATGAYTLTVEIKDEVTRMPYLDDEQKTRHTTTGQRVIQIDAQPPAASLDMEETSGYAPAGTNAANLQAGISLSTTLSGSVTERPVPLSVVWTAPAGAEPALAVECGGQTLYSVPGGAYVEVTNTYGWNGQADRGAACTVSVDPATVTGTVRVCDSQVAGWAAGTATTAFTASASTCGPDTAYAGVSGVEAAFTPLLLPSGDVRTVYSDTLARPVLDMPFDEQWAAPGSHPADLSGLGQQATLFDDSATTGTANKAVPGKAGAYALAFDGTGGVSVAPATTLDLSGGRFTQAVWVYPSPQDDSAYPILSGAAYQRASQQYPFMQIISRTRLLVGFGDGTNANMYTTGSILTAGAWNQVVATFDGTTYIVYVNGVEHERTSTFAGKTPYAARQFDLGRGVNQATPLCAAITLGNLTPHGLLRLRFSATLTADAAYTYSTGLYPTPDRPVGINQTHRFCGTAQISMRYAAATGAGYDLGTPVTFDTTSGSTSHLFSGALESATVDWTVTADPLDLRYFRGQLDDLRIYRRALPATEVADLYRVVWQPATVNTPGAGVSAWTAGVPDGLEGYYQLDLRGTDAAGQADNSGHTAGIWSGIADTLAPRVTLTRRAVGTNYRYTATAQDFNLTEQGFSSLCGAGVVSARTYFQPSWYTAHASAGRLSQLTAVCDLPIGTYYWGAQLGLNPMYGTGKVAISDSGTYAFVTTSTSGVRVVRVSNPYVPQVVSVMIPRDFMGNANTVNDVAVSGRYAYLADSRGLTIFDIFSISAPIQKGDLWTEGASAIAVSGQYAYVASGGASQTLYAIDVTDPNSPSITYIEMATPNMDDLAISGSYLYGMSWFGGQVYVFSLADPAVPTYVGTITLPSGAGNGVTAAGNYLYATGGYSGLYIYNVANPAAPVLTGTYSEPGWYAEGVTVSGTRAYVNGGRNGLRVLDVATPTAPTLLIQNWDAAHSNSYYLDVAYKGARIYVTDINYGLRIIDEPVVIAPAPLEATACDTLGNCTTAMLSTEAAAQPEAILETTATLTVTMAGLPSVISNVWTGYPLNGQAYAITSTLQALTVTLDSNVVYSDAWAEGAITQTNWSTYLWLPDVEGPHVVEARASDWEGNVDSDVLTITIDLYAPEAGIAPVIITGTRLYEPQQFVDVTGWVSDTATVPNVTVALAPGDLALPVELEDDTAPLTTTWHARWDLMGYQLPDGMTYTVTVTATDGGGRVVSTTAPVLVDVVPATLPALALNHAGAPVAPYGTVRAVAPTLTLTWTQSTDGSGLGDYLVEWTSQTTGAPTTLVTSVPPAGLLSDSFAAGDGQKVAVRVAAQDVYGQATSQSLGPVYVDSPHTPDYVLLDDPDGVYLGWMDSGCTLAGVDRRVETHTPAGAALNAEQKLYATWNDEALRLAWTGANWNTGGDLFAYLNVRPGGATAAFDPFSETPSGTILLPDGMAADYLVWVRDSATALLLEWNGGEWEHIAALGAGQYRYHALANGGHTDLYLPFALLGIADPAAQSLDLIALASKEDALRPWAAMPAANPVNSPLATDGVAGDELALTQRFHWDQLGNGLCPNGSEAGAPTPFRDAQLSAWMEAVPGARAYDLLSGELFWLQQMLEAGAPPADPAGYAFFANTPGAPVGNGQAITYNVQVRNRGTYTATGVSLAPAAYYQLSLTSGAAIAAGDIAPGEEVTVTFTAAVDTGLSAQPWAAVAVALYDDAHGPSGQPLAWLWAHHAVDGSGPEFFGTLESPYYIGTGTVDLRGYAYDDSGIAGLWVDLQTPGAGAQSLDCSPGDPGAGNWSCAWDVTASNGGITPAGGATFQLQLRASDTLGQSSAWSRALPFVVDALPPAVTLDLAATQVASGSLVQGGEFLIAGNIVDAGGVRLVDVCMEGKCERAGLLPATGQLAVAVDDVPAAPPAIGSGTTCGGGEITRQFVVTDAFALADVSLGLLVAHDRREDLQVELLSPAGTRVRVLDGGAGPGSRNVNAWLYDAAPVELSAGDHVTAAMRYENHARPSQPLRAFQGEGSAGAWTLSVCDANPAADDGAYLSGRLMLTPRDDAPGTGAWTYRASISGTLDYVARTVTVYGQDRLGNRNADPLALTVWVDNVAPALTGTVAPGPLMLGRTARVLTGTVTDGSPSVTMQVYVETPGGAVTQYQAARDGATWWLDLLPYEEGAYLLQAVAADAAGNTTTQDYTVAVNWVNTPPVAQPDVVTATEDLPLAILVTGNDSDADEHGLTVTGVTTPAHGTAVISGTAQVVYTPALNYHGTDAFDYTISDGFGGTATATVTVTVMPVNDPPVAGADSATTAEDTPAPILVLANDTDIDGDTLSVTGITTPAHGTAVISGTTQVLYTPAADYHGPDTFDYTVSDGHGGTATAAITVTVTPVNDPPVAANDGTTTAEDTPVTISVLANDGDVDGDTLSVTSVTAPAHGSAVIVGLTQVIYTPAADYYGDDTFDYTVSDGHGGTATAAVTVTVTPVNDPPVPAIAPVGVQAEGSLVTFSGSYTDPDLIGTPHIVWNFGDVIVYGTLSPTHTYLDNGTYTVTLTVTDDRGAMGVAALEVVVENVAPVVNAGPDQTVMPGRPVQFAGSFTDPGAADMHTFTWDFGDGTTVSGTLAPAHRYSAPGVYTVTLTVTDDDGGQTADTLTVTVLYTAWTPYFAFNP